MKVTEETLKLILSKLSDFEYRIAELEASQEKKDEPVSTTDD